MTDEQTAERIVEYALKKADSAMCKSKTLKGSRSINVTFYRRRENQQRMAA